MRSRLTIQERYGLLLITALVAVIASIPLSLLNDHLTLLPIAVHCYFTSAGRALEKRMLTAELNEARAQQV